MMTRMISKIATLGFLAAVAAVAASPASAQATLDNPLVAGTKAAASHKASQILSVVGFQ